MNSTRSVSDYATALAFLLGHVNYERTTAIPYRASAFKLDRMRRLMGLLGDPHLALKAVHIAGTKGKGSTATMLAAILSASGRKTALYTSPHLDAIEERIAIDGLPCGQAQFVALAAELEQAVGRLSAEASDPQEGLPTFFEVTTAMAFLHFAREKVAAAVLEVGLGGRLDSTNVCRPCVCIITSISFDHTKQLGNTLAAIAGEKAGIIKPGVPVVSGVIEPEPQQVIRETAHLHQAPLCERGSGYDFAYGERMDYYEPAQRPAFRLNGLAIGMLGRHQAANGAAAVAAIRRLNEQGWNVPETAIRGGLAEARCPARIEMHPGRPTVILDVAHNVASIAALLDVIRERFAGRRRILIFASSKDKDTAGMLRLLLPQFDEVILTRYLNNPRAVELEQLRAMATSLLAPAASNGSFALPLRIRDADSPAKAWRLARESATGDDLVCIAGSFFLAAELRPLLLEAKLDAATEAPA